MITPGSVKICSLRRPEHAAMVVSAGADYFGLIFVPDAWRYIDPLAANAIVSEMRRLGGRNGPRAVGVFTSTDADEINRIADEAELDIVQVHVGDDIVNWSAIERPVVPVFRPAPLAAPADLRKRVAALMDRSDRIAAVLIDAYHPTVAGGVGVLGNWEAARDVALSQPTILAGGLTPDNVASAIESVRPRMVDVSSGVETDKVKDAAKIQAFVHNARIAFSVASVR